ncbi:hypothetical protein [Flexithrix dorotheae]|nr:hypothetical protein [Flexithrix dorotheae]
MATVGRIEVGGTYTFATHYAGRWLTGDLSVKQSENKVVIELPDQYCISF